MPVISLGKCGRSYGAAALAVILSISVVGCSGPDETEATNKNRAAWAMPLDEFHVYPVALDNYAEQLLIADCLTSQGYEWPVPWQDTEFPLAEDFNSVGLRLFTPELAKKWGYHFATPVHEESVNLWGEFIATTESYFPNVELDTALLDCRNEVREQDEDSFVNFDGVNYLAGLAMQAEQVALQDESVVEATAKWRECLEPQLPFTLPKVLDPWTEMPPSAVGEEWGIGTGGTPAPSVEELAAAVADAECRETSGLSAAKYEKTWEEQQRLVTENRDKLDRIRSEATERKSKLLTIVAENAPAAP